MKVHNIHKSSKNKWISVQKVLLHLSPLNLCMFFNSAKSNIHYTYMPFSYENNFKMFLWCSFGDIDNQIFLRSITQLVCKYLQKVILKFIVLSKDMYTYTFNGTFGPFFYLTTTSRLLWWTIGLKKKLLKVFFSSAWTTLLISKKIYDFVEWRQHQEYIFLDLTLLFFCGTCFDAVFLLPTFGSVEF